MPDIQQLSLDRIRRDGGAQPRATIDQETVNAYAEHLTDGGALPPGIAFFDGKDYWLADGFHRDAAYAVANKKIAPVEVRQGTQRDAILYSVGANATHGLPRTYADKCRAIQTLLNDPDWSKMPVMEVSRRCRLPISTARRIHDKLTGENPHLASGQVRNPDSDSETKNEKTYTTKHGTQSTMNVAKIGKTKKADFTKEDVEEMNEAFEAADPAKATPEETPTETTPAAEETPKQPAAPWAEFESEVKGCMTDLRAVAEVLRTAFGYDPATKQLKTKWANGYSYSGTVGTILAVVRSLDDGLPVEDSPNPPGFVTKKLAQLNKKAVEAGRAA